MLISLEEVRELGVMCPCVGKHVPLPTQFHKHHIVPLYLGGSNDKSNLFVLCPTTHYNIHALLQKYGRNGGTPPGSVRKHYSDFVQRLAKQAWDGRNTPATASMAGESMQFVVDPWWEQQAHEDSGS